MAPAQPEEAAGTVSLGAVPGSAQASSPQTGSLSSPSCGFFKFPAAFCCPECFVRKPGVVVCNPLRILTSSNHLSENGPVNFKRFESTTTDYVDYSTAKSVKLVSTYGLPNGTMVV